MPFILEFAAPKRKKKTRNCSKGYNCGNSCINKGRKCKRKFSDQASTYAGWLKKNSNKTVGNSKNTRSKLNKMVDDAVKIKTFKPDKGRQAIAKELDQRGRQVKKDLSNLVSNDGLNRQKVIRITEIPSPSGKENFFEVDYADNSKGKGKGYFSQSDLYKKIPGSQKYIEDRNKLNADIAKFNSNSSDSTKTRNKQLKDELRTFSYKPQSPLEKAKQKEEFNNKIVDDAYINSAKKELGKPQKKEFEKNLVTGFRNDKRSVKQKVPAEVYGDIAIYKNDKGGYDTGHLESGAKLLQFKTKTLAKEYVAILKKEGLHKFKVEQQDSRINPTKINLSPKELDLLTLISGHYSSKNYINFRSQNFSEQKISKGSTVTWKWGKGKANGKVLAVYHRSVTRKLGGSSITRNGTKDNPAYLIGQNDGSKILKLQSELIL